MSTTNDGDVRGSVEDGAASSPVATVDTATLAAWQQIVDLVVRLCKVPAGLIMRVTGEDIEVFIRSQDPGNPYHVGDRERLAGSGLYCEHVIRHRERLLIPNALADEAWKDNPDARLGMISFLGFPIIRPSGDVFGTICVLDCKENPYGQDAVELLGQMRALVEAHLRLLNQNELMEQQTAEIRVLRGIIPICSSCKRIRNDRGYYDSVEAYVRRHSHAVFSHTLCPECLARFCPGSEPETRPHASPSDEAASTSLDSSSP